MVSDAAHTAGGSDGWSNRKQSGRSSARRRLARNPKLRMRTKPRGSRWSRKRRRNSSTGRVISRFLLPVPQGFGTVQSNGIQITDTNLGLGLGQILLSEQIASLAQSVMDFDGTGNRLFLITNKGLTIVQLPPPALSIGYLSPATGPASGGTTATVRGSGFEAGATTSVGGAGASTTFIDSNTLQITIPPGSVGGARVLIQNPGGTTYSLDAGFTYQ